MGGLGRGGAVGQALGAQGTAGGRVRVMRVVDCHTANHVGPLVSTRAVTEKRKKTLSFSF